VCDPWGTSDPYCFCPSIKDVNGHTIKTKIIKRTLNPEWNAAFDFVSTLPFLFRCELWDADVVGEDDSMG
jgi:Ca2+-dependent lipid-binding protein